MKTRVIFDGNSLGYTAHQGASLKTGDQETQAIIGVLKSVRNYRFKYPDASQLILWDGRSWRKDVSKVYKAQRDDTPEKREARERYKRQKPFIVKGLRLLGVPQLIAGNLEADDYAAKFSKAARVNGEMVHLVTGDQDWIQLVHDRCTWEDHKPHKTTGVIRQVNVSNFMKETGFRTPLQFAQAKSLQGDISDNLTGVGMIGEKKAEELIGIWGSVEAFLADSDREATYLKAVTTAKSFPKAYRDFASMEDRQAKFRENMRLMCLLDELPSPINQKLDTGSYDPDGFRQFCKELGFLSIYANQSQFEIFLEPFKKEAK